MYQVMLLVKSPNHFTAIITSEIEIKQFMNTTRINGIIWPFTLSNLGSQVTGTYGLTM